MLLLDLLASYSSHDVDEFVDRYHAVLAKIQWMRVIRLHDSMQSFSTVAYVAIRTGLLPISPDLDLVAVVGQCNIARWTGCRISEVLGLQWKHLDLATGWVRIRQRWYRGDLDVVKSERSNRDLPLGYLVDELKRLAESRGPAPDDFVFDLGDGQPHDDRELLKIIRWAARKLGFYFEGFGFHSFRRSNITRIQSTVGASALEAQLHAGHSRASMTGEYTQIEAERHQELVRKMQEAALVKSQVVH